MFDAMKLPTLVNNARERLSARWMHELLSTKKGLAYFLGELSSVERDELKLFDALLARVPDERLAGLVRKHRDDEVRHEAILRECADRVGVPAIETPLELQVPFLLQEKLGGLTQSFFAGEAEVWEVYALLQVLEERAVREYPRFIEALEPRDPRSTDVLRSVLADEKRHVGYARAVAQQYAPSAAAHERMLTCYRAVEAQVFEDQQRALTLFLLDRGLLALPRAETAFLRALCQPRGGGAGMAARA